MHIRRKPCKKTKLLHFLTSYIHQICFNKRPLVRTDGTMKNKPPGVKLTPGTGLNNFHISTFANKSLPLAKPGLEDTSKFSIYDRKIGVVFVTTIYVIDSSISY